MSTGNDKEFALAKVYAAAMLKLADASRQEQVLHDELKGFAAFVEGDADFRAFLEAPTVDTATRQRTLEKLFRGKYSDLMLNSLQVLNRNDRLRLVGAVAETYHQLYEEKLGRVEVDVRTATSLSDPLRVRLREILTRTTGKEVDLLEKVDDSLIGGMVVQIGDDKYDNSVRTKLRILGHALLERASREIHSGRTYAAG